MKINLMFYLNTFANEFQSRKKREVVALPLVSGKQSLPLVKNL